MLVSTIYLQAHFLYGSCTSSYREKFSHACPTSKDFPCFASALYSAPTRVLHIWKWIAFWSMVYITAYLIIHFKQWTYLRRALRSGCPPHVCTCSDDKILIAHFDTTRSYDIFYLQTTLAPLLLQQALRRQALPIPSRLHHPSSSHPRPIPYPPLLQRMSYPRSGRSCIQKGSSTWALSSSIGDTRQTCQSNWCQ